MRNIRYVTNCTVILLTLFCATSTSYGAESAKDKEETHAQVQEKYTKFEYQIPMRDGAKLFTVVYVPKDSSKSYPFLFARTPYSVRSYGKAGAGYGVHFTDSQLGPSREFDESGYIFVKQDVRGRYMSEGKWAEMTPHAPKQLRPGFSNESHDMYDTVEWLLKTIPNNNGRVGIWGISYPGFYAAASAVEGHPAIKAISPQAPVTNLYMGDDAYHGGAFMLAGNFGFYSQFIPHNKPTPKSTGEGRFDYQAGDAYEFFLRHKTLQQISQQLGEANRTLYDPMWKNANYSDFWIERDISRHVHKIKAAVLTVGGWFDAEDLAGPLTIYRALSKSSHPDSTLVMGPWSHGAWQGAGRQLGAVNFDSATSDFYQKKLLFPFFEKHLKGNGAAPDKSAYVFETGTNIWRQYPVWPPKQAQVKSLFFNASGTLSWIQSSQDGQDEYVSDPSKPVPFIGYAAHSVPREYMVSDQRFAGRRPDVLVYQSDILEQDVTFAGPISPKLFVSTTGTDSDWIVKLIDVYPTDFPNTADRKLSRSEGDGAIGNMGGYQQLVRGEPLRGKYRNGFESVVPFVPGKIEKVEFTMPDVNHTFRRGHRIMVQIQSSWFPLIDLNPQKFMDIPTAVESDFQKVTNVIYRSQQYPSSLQVHVLK